MNFASISTNHHPSFVGVPQDAYAITTAADTRNILMTSKVTTCMVIALYDREKKVGALMHLSTGNRVEKSFEKLTKNLKRIGSDLSQLEITVIGGYKVSSSENLYCKICEALEPFGAKIKDLTFEKRELSSYLAVSKVADLRTKLSASSNEDERKKILSELNNLIEDVSYTQISLDTKSGEFSETSKYEFRIDQTSKSDSYSEKAIKRDALIISFRNRYENAKSWEEREDIIQNSFLTATKTYDATKITEGSGISKAIQKEQHEGVQMT